MQEKQILNRISKAEQRLVDLYKKLSSGVSGSQALDQTLVIGNNTGGTDILLNDTDAIQLENGSSIRKGNYDFGQNGGVSRICGVGYEDMWQAGFRHVFDSNGLIRNTTNGFNIIPDSSFDFTLRFKIGSFWSLDDGTTYMCTDATTGAAVWVLYSSPSGTQITKVLKTTITSAQVLQLFTTPITILNSNNPLTVAYPINVYIKRKVGTAYTLASTSFSVVNDFGTTMTGNLNPNPLTNTDGYFQSAISLSQNLSGGDKNTLYKLKANVGNPTLGTGDLEVYVTYVEITL